MNDYNSNSGIRGGSDTYDSASDLALYREIRHLHQRLTVLLEKVSTAYGEGPETRHAEPDLDIYENDHEYLIQAALPGTSPQDIQIKATPHALTLSARGHAAPSQNSSPNEIREKRTQHRRSRYSQSQHYHFVYTLPVAIVPQSVQAILNHGMLELRLPKQQSAAVSSVTIPVQLRSEGEILLESGMVASQAVISLSDQTGTPSLSRTQEGNPSHKMGMAYIPSAGEDHIMQAHSAGVKTLGKGHAWLDETEAITTGQTNPLAVPEEEIAAYSKL